MIKQVNTQVPNDHSQQCLRDILGITMWERCHGFNIPYPIPRYYKSGMEIPRDILPYIEVTNRNHLGVVRVQPAMIKEAEVFCSTYYA